MTIDLSGGLDAAKEFVLAERPEVAAMRDAVNVWIEDDNGAFGMRIGIEAVAEEWDAHDVWLDIAFADGRVLSQRGAFKTLPAIDPQGQPSIRATEVLRFQCIKPFAVWTTHYRGPADETTAAELIQNPVLQVSVSTDVEFEIAMSMAVPPWEPGSLLEEARAALMGEQGEFMSPRYEQLFRAKGWLQTGGERREFSGCGLRIRRQGVRKFAGFSGHCWQSAIFPSGKAFGFNVYPPRSDGIASYNEGFIFDGNTVIPARAVSIPWLRNLQTGGDDVSFVLETVAGDRVSINGETFINCRSRGHTVLPPGFPIVQQAHARYRWDGEQTVGMIERSSMPELVSGEN